MSPRAPTFRRNTQRLQRKTSGSTAVLSVLVVMTSLATHCDLLRLRLIALGHVKADPHASASTPISQA